jgi:hypothetical protein
MADLRDQDCELYEPDGPNRLHLREGAVAAGNLSAGIPFPPMDRGGALVMATKSNSRWSGDVTEHSDALDVERDLFKAKDPDRIARSLKHSAEASHRRKSNPYRSAMSMLTFYINRAGKTLSKSRRRTLDQAKTSLRRLFHREAAH